MKNTTSYVIAGLVLAGFTACLFKWEDVDDFVWKTLGVQRTVKYIPKRSLAEIEKQGTQMGYSCTYPDQHPKILRCAKYDGMCKTELNVGITNSRPSNFFCAVSGPEGNTCDSVVYYSFLDAVRLCSEEKAFETTAYWVIHNFKNHEGDTVINSLHYFMGSSWLSCRPQQPGEQRR